MRSAPAAAAFQVALLLTAGLSLSIGCAPIEEHDVTYVRDVKPILDARCNHCHTAGEIGPMVLDSYDAAAGVAELIAEVTESGQMPPYLADPDCRDYSFDPTLNEDQLAVLRAWADDGAPEGIETEEPPVAPIALLDFDANTFDPDMVLSPPEVYTPTTTFGTDDYRCFLIDWPATEDKFVTGFTTRPDNKRIVHHVIGYLIPPEDVADIRAIDAAEPGPGYTCFGGPGLRRPQWIGGWAPGGQGGSYPEGTGIRVRPGSVIALQVHYHLDNGTGPDQTSVEVALADSVDKEAIILPFTNPVWTTGEGMEIPAGQADVAHTFGVNVADMQEQPEPFLMHSANLHMHELGRAGSLWIDRADGTRECVLDIPRWDFEWQLSYGFDPVEVRPGDSLNIECRWDNSGGHTHDGEPTGEEPVDVHWGEGTGDEMCLGVFYVSQQ
jgi:hypothetical protein